MNTAAKLLRRFGEGESLGFGDLRPVLTGYMILALYDMEYVGLGNNRSEQLATTLLFLAAGVKPEEFL